MIIELLSWWYSSGLKSFVANLRERLVYVADFFGIGNLFATLFLPFRQISANESAGDSLQGKLQVLGDRLISRIVGFVARISLILIGLICLIFSSVASILALICYPFLPLLPVFFIVLFFVGVTI